MFTGIVEEIGEVIFISEKKSESDRSDIEIKIKCKEVLKDLKEGGSIAVNGCCITATMFDEHSFSAIISIETQLLTNLRFLKKGSLVNLEAAMKVNTRNSGHNVEGHISGVGKISRKEKDGDSIRYTVEADSEILNFIVKKGFVSVDGISLTVTDKTATDFSVMITSYTQKYVTLTNKEIGYIINIETDIIGKYVYNHFKTLEERIVELEKHCFNKK